MPASVAMSVPGVNMPMPARHIVGSSPATAVMNSFWSIAPSSARRIAALLNGACRLLVFMNPSVPLRSLISTRILPVLRSTGSRSGVGNSHQSISPARMALAEVPSSGLVSHSTRSKCTTLPPAVQPVLASGRGK